MHNGPSSLQIHSAVVPSLAVPLSAAESVARVPAVADFAVGLAAEAEGELVAQRQEEVVPVACTSFVASSYGDPPWGQASVASCKDGPSFEASWHEGKKRPLHQVGLQPWNLD
jgi:hypothetical protein